MNAQSACSIDELTVECISMTTVNQNLIVNIVIVSKDVIEDANKYNPQPTFLTSLFRKVIKEKKPNDVFDCILLRKISLIVKPMPFVYKLH